MLANGFWWHPDGLTLLGSALVLFGLKDGLRLGGYFICCRGLRHLAKSVGLLLPLVLWFGLSKQLASAVNARSVRHLPSL